MLLLLISVVVVVVVVVVFVVGVFAVVLVSANILGHIDPKIWKFRVYLVLNIKIYGAKASNRLKLIVNIQLSGLGPKGAPRGPLEAPRYAQNATKRSKLGFNIL
jgi:hypothetical protein